MVKNVEYRLQMLVRRLKVSWKLWLLPAHLLSQLADERLGLYNIQILFKYHTNIIQISYKQHTNIIQILYKLYKFRKTATTTKSLLPTSYKIAYKYIISCHTWQKKDWAGTQAASWTEDLSHPSISGYMIIIFTID